MSRGTPGGRGPRVTRDALPSQEESYRTRQSFRPTDTPFYYHSFGNLYAPTELFTVTGDEIRQTVFFAMPPIYQRMRFETTFMPIFVPADPPPEVISVQYALYRYVDGDPYSLRKVSATQVTATVNTFLGPSKYGSFIGNLSQKSVNFDTGTLSQQLFMGYSILSGIGNSLVGVSYRNPAGGPFAGQKVATFPALIGPSLAVGEDIPDQVFRPFPTMSDNIFIPSITYFTRDGARLFGALTP
jgi:hypothetical protein